MVVVRVSFKGNLVKLYDYFTELDLDIGEPVVVPTGSGYSVAKVENVLQESKKATSWVVQKVDVQGHKERMRLREKAEMEDMLS